MSVKYLQIYHAIREKILSNEYAINQQLPDEITLTKEFNSSRMTVKKSIRLTRFRRAYLQKTRPRYLCPLSRHVEAKTYRSRTRY